VQAECLQQQQVAPCQTNSQGPDVVQAALRAVPPYCCTADLLFKAPPELVDLALSLRAPDISRLITSTFCELAALLELVSRSPESGWIDPDDPAQPAPAAGVPGTAELRHAASKDSSRSPCASTGSGGASTERLSGSQRPHLQHMAELQDVVDRFYGVLTIIFALQPMPLVEAACLNHRTQEQVAAPKQHWQVSTQHAARRIVARPSHTALQSELRTCVGSVRSIEVIGCSSRESPADYTLLVFRCWNASQTWLLYRMANVHPANTCMHRSCAGCAAAAAVDALSDSIPGHRPRPGAYDTHGTGSCVSFLHFFPFNLILPSYTWHW